MQYTEGWFLHDRLFRLKLLNPDVVLFDQGCYIFLDLLRSEERVQLYPELYVQLPPLPENYPGN